MRPLSPSQPSLPLASPSEGMVVHGVDVTAQAVADMVGTQQALGASFGEALGMTATALGVAAVVPLWKGYLASMDAPGGPMRRTLDDVGTVAPDMANALLDMAMRGGLPEWNGGVMGMRGWHFDGCDWLTHLEGDLKVECDLHLRRCMHLENLPSGMSVGGGLDLFRCAALKRLPQGLRLGSYLDMLGCTSMTDLPEGLDVPGFLRLKRCSSLERIPRGLWVGEALYMEGCSSWDGQFPDDLQVNMVFTPAHTTGISLDEWRERHPQGERA